MPETKTRARKCLRLIKTELVPRVSEPGPAIKEPLVAGKELAALIGSKDREHFVVFHLDTRHRVQSFEIAAIGSLNAAIVHPREVFKGAILANAHAIICGHNHPSGDPTPSEDDCEMHRRLEQVGELIGIEVLDLLIVAGTRCWSARLGGETW